MDKWGSQGELGGYSMDNWGARGDWEGAVVGTGGTGEHRGNWEGTAWITGGHGGTGRM